MTPLTLQKPCKKECNKRGLETMFSNSQIQGVSHLCRPYVSMPDFEPEVVKKASKAAFGLCCWVRAMEAYDR
jgi:SET domain-containing protein